MYTKKLLSAAAAVAVMSTGAMAFDTNTTGALLKYNEEAGTVTVGTYTDANISISGRSSSALLKDNPGALGDALIYPAFFSDHGWQSEFTVVNTSSTHAVVAKVVLYGRENSKELKDFNIYLSANDVFRATIKDGVITSTDGSTVVEGTDSYTQNANGTYTDSVTMASDATPFSTSLDEPAGYIAVYAMAESNASTLKGDVNTSTDDPAMKTASKTIDMRYHGMHKELWQDYRHLLDQCRTSNWRSGINGGIYTDDQDKVSVPLIDMGNKNCSNVISAQDANDNDISDGNMSFTPPSAVLAGSIRVSGDDSRGTRSMLLPATPLLNFSPGGSYKVAGVTTNPVAPEGNYSVLWTEGEFASLADRYIDWNATTNSAEYNATAMKRDCLAQFSVTKVLYEFKNAENSMVIMTQPFKRTLIQLNAANITSPQTVCAYKEVVRGTAPAGQAGGLVTNYGGFKMGASIYDDDENKFNPATGGFTVSPATTPTTLIPNELSAFNPIPDTSGVTEGYAVLDLTRTASNSLGAIVTQMSATTVSDTVETNWIYNLVNY